MLVVGLTGGISTGKSTVSNLLRARGAPVIDADVVARQVVEPGTPALCRIRESFGEDVLQSDGTLDRKKLGTIIFNDERKRKKLNGIVHPAVRKAMLWAILRHWIAGHKYLVLDVPLLIEGGLWQWVGKVVVVHCVEDLQLMRLMLRDGSSREEAGQRLRAQLPIAEKIQYADLVIENSGTRLELEQQVDGVVRRLDRAAGWAWMVCWLCPPVGLAAAGWTLARRWWGILHNK